MAEKITNVKRKKPKFYRTAWNKMHKLGKKVESKRKWRNAHGRDNKRRLKERGYARTPNSGWSSAKDVRNQVSGVQVMRVETLNDFKNVPKGYGVVIGSVGKKKQSILVDKAKELKLTVVNRYKGDKK